MRENTAYRIVRKLKIEEGQKTKSTKKEKNTKNPPHQCDKCGHCCGIMNSPQHPGLPPHGAGDLQPLVLTVPFFFFQMQLMSLFPPSCSFKYNISLFRPCCSFKYNCCPYFLKVLECLPSGSLKTQRVGARWEERIIPHSSNRPFWLN